jgi:hypothetical protein
LGQIFTVLLLEKFFEYKLVFNGIKNIKNGLVTLMRSELQLTGKLFVIFQDTLICSSTLYRIGLLF